MHPTLLLVGSPRSDWDALCAAAQTSPAVRLLACVQQARVALSMAARHQPSVVLADADVPDRPIVPFVGDLRAASPASKVVLLGERAVLDQGTLAALWHRGIAGYFIWEDVRPKTLPNALATVLGTDVLVGSRAVLEVLLAPDRRQQPRVEGLVLTAPEREALGREINAPVTARAPVASRGTASTAEVAGSGEAPTPRELDVLCLTGEGLSNKAIAQQLRIRERTVRFHIENLFSKLDASSRTEMLVRARQCGWQL